MSLITSFQQQVDILSDYFKKHLLEDGDGLSYKRIMWETGLDVRGVGKNYQACERVRKDVVDWQNPFMIERDRGKGLVRVRIGMGAPMKSSTRLKRTRRLSERSMHELGVGLRRSVDQEEVALNRTHLIIHTSIAARTTYHEFRNRYHHVSSGSHPKRPIVDVNEVLRRHREELRESREKRQGK